MIKIPQPKALLLERVWVFNNRKGKKNDYQDGEWELGNISHAQFHLYARSSTSKDVAGMWSYEVILYRRTPLKVNRYGRETGGNLLRLYVSDQKIKKI